MPSTYSSALRLELIGGGEQSGTWGVTTNRNFGTLVEAAVAGVATVTLTDADYTLTVVNGNVDEARNAVLVVSGAITAIRRIIIPSVTKKYTVRNATTGGFDLQVKTLSGASATIPFGKTAALFCDGTDCHEVKTTIISSDVSTALGYTPYNATNPSGYITVAQLAAYATVNSPALTGTPTAPTATAGNSTTQIATTAFVQSAVVASTTGVSSFAGRTGAITLLTGDVTTALGFTPYNSTNPSGYITATTAPVRTVFGRTGAVTMTSADVTSALGYTPYNSTNPSSYITSGALNAYLTSATAANTYYPKAGSQYFPNWIGVENVNGDNIAFWSDNQSREQYMSFYTGGLKRMFTGCFPDGRGWYVAACEDDGAYKSVPFQIRRSDNAAIFVGDVFAGAYYVQSSRELKQDIGAVSDGALERVLKWDVKEYAYKAKPETRTLGLIAEDADARISDGATINMTAAVFELAAAVQELARGR